MEPSVWPAVITGSAALVGVSLGALLTAQVQKSSGREDNKSKPAPPSWSSRPASSLRYVGTGSIG